MSRLLTIAVYLALVAVMIVADVIAHRREDLLVPLGRLLDEATARRPVRVTLVAFWWWLGWHFLLNT